MFGITVYGKAVYGKSGYGHTGYGKSRAIKYYRTSTETINKREKKEIQHRYGSYENVLISDTEYGKLRQEFPGDYQIRVERLSEYMASTGRSYKNHLATIRSWAKREKPKYNPADYTFEEGDSL